MKFSGFFENRALVFVPDEGRQFVGTTDSCDPDVSDECNGLPVCGSEVIIYAARHEDRPAPICVDACTALELCIDTIKDDGLMKLRPGYIACIRTVESPYIGESVTGVIREVPEE